MRAAASAGRAAFVNRALLQCGDLFAKHLHHRKEDRHLFRRLRLRAHQADELLDLLEADHGARADRRGMRAQEDVSVGSIYGLIADSW